MPISVMSGRMLGDFVDNVKLNQIFKAYGSSTVCLDVKGFHIPKKVLRSRGFLGPDKAKAPKPVDDAQVESLFSIIKASGFLDSDDSSSGKEDLSGTDDSIPTRATTPESQPDQNIESPPAGVKKLDQVIESITTTFSSLADQNIETPSSFVEKAQPSLDTFAENSLPAEPVTPTPWRRPEKSSFSAPNFPAPQSYSPQDSDEDTRLFSWQWGRFGPLTPVEGHRRSRSLKHETLSMGMIPLHGKDGMLKVRAPEVTGHGIHAFLDLSNIHISFQKTMKIKHGIHENARMVPIPGLNLEFLTELLVRGRDAKVLNVGCSVVPGAAEPFWVTELRELDYRVDLIERKRVEDTAEMNWRNTASPLEETPSRSFGSSFNKKNMSRQPPVRFVEDRVDETIHTRVGESIIDYLDKPGTMVLATGDAKPAKYTDGFLAYAQRALKLGWNVEVVSWRCSLSNAWREAATAGQWGDRLRIIELDDFLDDLTL